MSDNILKFIGEASLVWGVLLAFYLLALRHHYHWATHRRYLLLTWVLGLVLPLLPSVDLGQTVPAAARLPGAFIGYLTTQSSAPQPVAVEGFWTWPTSLLLIYTLGVVISALVVTVQLVRHLRPHPLSPTTYDGYPVIRSERVRSPYALCGRIYLPAALDPDLERTALIHEAAHLTNGHDKERLLMVLGNVFCWFHPLQWVFARRLAEVHEFEADRAVTDRLSARVYAGQLLQATLAPRMVPGLFSSPLKKRLMHLQRNVTSRPLGAGKWTALLLLVAGLLLVCNDRGLLAQSPASAATTTFTLEEVQSLPTAPKFVNESYVSFAEGMEQTLRYPQAPLSRNELGKVMATVSVSAAGELTDVTTRVIMPGERLPTSNTLSVGGEGTGGDILVDMNSTAFTGEVDRAIRALGAFRPATRDGVAVPSIIEFQVIFGPFEPQD